MLRWLSWIKIILWTVTCMVFLESWEKGSLYVLLEFPLGWGITILPLRLRLNYDRMVILVSFRLIKVVFGVGARIIVRAGNKVRFWVGVRIRVEVKCQFFFYLPYFQIFQQKTTSVSVMTFYPSKFRTCFCAPTYSFITDFHRLIISVSFSQIKVVTPIFGKTTKNKKRQREKYDFSHQLN